MATAFRSERLVYRAIEETDDDFFFRLNTDTTGYLNAMPFLAQPPGKKAAKSSREWLESCLLGVMICLPPSPTPPTSASHGDDNGKREKAEPKPIGFIHLTGGDPKSQHHRRGSVGIVIDREHQAKGYGSEAILWILNWAFTMGNLHRVEIGSFGFNEKAAALYQRLGFKHEGRRREWMFFEGRYWDLIEMGILQHEWMELHGVKRAEAVIANSSVEP